MGVLPSPHSAGLVLSCLRAAAHFDGRAFLRFLFVVSFVACVLVGLRHLGSLPDTSRLLRLVQTNKIIRILLGLWELSKLLKGLPRRSQEVHGRRGKSSELVGGPREVLRFTTKVI